MNSVSRAHSGSSHHHVGPGTRIYEVVRRTLVGTWQDGFIHAGNLAYHLDAGDCAVLSSLARRDVLSCSAKWRARLTVSMAEVVVALPAAKRSASAGQPGG